MTREEHLKFCKVCKNRFMAPEHGLVCSLTGKLADFDPECPEFIEDANVQYLKANPLYHGKGELGAKSINNIMAAIIVALILVRYFYVYNLIS